MGRAGVKVVNDPMNGEYIHNTDPSISVEEFTSMQVDPEVEAVICGINYDFCYRTLCVASLFIQINKASFIATNTDRVFSTCDPLRKCPAGGSLVQAIAS